MEREEQERGKRAAAERAAALIEEGMRVGLGTGSTAQYFIESLSARCRAGLRIEAVASSTASQRQAEAGGIPLIDWEQITRLDLTVDGADEVDTHYRLIKGKGGALLREKILAMASRKMMVIIDESKRVSQLGKCGLAVELVRFGYTTTLRLIEKQGYRGMLRRHPDDSLILTENGNYLLDIHSPTYFATPEEDHLRLIQIAGVVETGFFFQRPLTLLVGHSDGSIAEFHVFV